MNNLSKNELLLSFLVEDEKKEKEILTDFYRKLRSVKGTTVDPEQLFLEYLKENGIIIQGIFASDEYCEDITGAERIDRIIREYFRYKEAQKCGIM